MKNPDSADSRPEGQEFYDLPPIPGPGVGGFADPGGKDKERVIRVDRAIRCCEEACRIVAQSANAWFAGAMAEIWEGPPSEGATYQMWTEFVSTPKGPVVEPITRMGWRTQTGSPGTLGAILAVGSIVLSILGNEAARTSVQSVVETAYNAGREATRRGYEKGTKHCKECMRRGALPQNRARKRLTMRYSKRV